MTSVSPAVARELYPIAVRQARQGVVTDLAAAVVIAIGAAILWASGYPAVNCFIASSLLGGPAISRGLLRWRRLRRMRPLDAAAQGEL